MLEGVQVVSEPRPLADLADLNEAAHERVLVVVQVHHRLRYQSSLLYQHPSDSSKYHDKIDR